MAVGSDQAPQVDPEPEAVLTVLEGLPEDAPDQTPQVAAGSEASPVLAGAPDHAFQSPAAPVALVVGLTLFELVGAPDQGSQSPFAAPVVGLTFFELCVAVALPQSAQ